jgi:hypothetical protein
MLAPVVEMTALVVLHVREDLALRSTVACAFIGDELPWYIQYSLEQLTNGFVGYGNAAFAQEFLHIAVAQVKREESQTPWLTISAGKQ